MNNNVAMRRGSRRNYKLNKIHGEWIMTLPIGKVNLTTGEGASDMRDNIVKKEFLKEAKAMTLLMDMQDIQSSGDAWLKFHLPETEVETPTKPDHSIPVCTLHLGRFAKAYINL